MPRKSKQQKKDVLQPRPPIVVVLGHVDSGKTSILDTIRKTHVAERESGGITQHVGAYEVEFPASSKLQRDEQGKKITFIDTPGHEAFSAMRARGAKVADIAILVVAADEGIKPQTKEAISHIKKSGIPVVVALNKIDKLDKPHSQIEKVKGELAKEDILVESKGGKIPSIEISAKTGKGVDELLEMINLVAEIEEIKGNRSKPAEGVVIESYLDSKRGPTVTLLIREGILKVGDIVGTASAYGKIKTLENFQFENIKQAFSSMPVIVTGLSEVPEVGEKFYKRESLESAEIYLEKKARKKIGEGEILSIEPGKKVLNLIIKSDVRGSLQAIHEVLRALPQDEIILRILKSEVGEINESDIKLAAMSHGLVVGFRTKINPNAVKLAERSRLKVLTFEVIYELVQGIRSWMSSLSEPEIVRKDLGEIKILAIFRTEKSRQIVGGKVISGGAKKGALIEVFRNEEKIGRGKLVQLQQNKKDAERAIKGSECGILFEGNIRIAEGDILKIYEEERRKLSL